IRCFIQKSNYEWLKLRTATSGLLKPITSHEKRPPAVKTIFKQEIRFDLCFKLSLFIFIYLNKTGRIIDRLMNHLLYPLLSLQEIPKFGAHRFVPYQAA